MLVSCTYEVHPTQLVERQGKFYEINSTTPFTGSSVMYYDNGQLYERRNYEDGKLEGLLEEYRQNGQLRMSNNYKNGKRVDGPEYTYHPSGKIFMSKDYKNGKLHGLDLRWKESGRLFHRACYKNGERINKGSMISVSDCKVD